ncbi:MAG: hypothetical protein WCE44_03830 [Candidatus Velthaea sp.]|jgi:hypothetical protein
MSNLDERNFQIGRPVGQNSEGGSLMKTIVAKAVILSSIAVIGTALLPLFARF